MNFLINLVCFIIFSPLVEGQVSSLKIQPEKPKPGETIAISYNPTGSILEKAEKISVIIHAYGKTYNDVHSLYYTNEINLKKRGDSWIGQFSVADTCAGVLLRFTNGENYDNNNSKFHPIRFYNKDGKFVKGASAGLSLVYSVYRLVLEINPNPKTLLKLFNEEFTLYPELKKSYTLAYYGALVAIDEAKAAEFLNKEITRMEKIAFPSLIDLTTLRASYYNQKPFNKSKAEKINAIILEKKYPNSQYLESFLLSDSVQKLIQDGKFEEAFNKIKINNNTSSDDYNKIAWSMYEKDANLTLAKKIAFSGIKLLGAEKDYKWSNERPVYYSERQFKSTYDKEIFDTYGAILLKLGENAEALKYLTQAYEMYGGRDAEINERYAQALIVNGKSKKAMEGLEKFILTGISTPKMKGMLKQCYVKLKGSDVDFDTYVLTLESNAKKKN